jgi:hypothetical protein
VVLPVYHPARSSIHSFSSIMRAFLCTLALLVCGSAAAQAPVFRLNYLPGVRYVLTQHDTTETSTTIGLPVEMGGSREMAQRQVTRTEYDVRAEVESDSLYLVTMTLRRVRAWMEQDGVPRILDTDSAASLEDNPLAFMNVVLVGFPMRLRVGLDGKAREMLDLDSLAQRMTRAMPPELREMMEGVVPESREGYSNGVYDLYPNRAVQPGDTWRTTNQGLTPFPIETRLTYTLDRLTGDQAYVRYEGAMASPADAAPMGQGPMAMHLNVTGTLSGTWVANLSDGTYTMTTRSQTEGTGAQAESVPGMPTMTMRVRTRTAGRAELRRAAP